MRLFQSSQRPGMAVVCAGLIVLNARALLAAQETQPATQPVEKNAEQAPTTQKREPEILRVVENKGKSISLQIASRDYVKPDGTGPKVALVGVAHIGDRDFYRAIEKLLSEYEIVLYESVKPPGAGGAGGETDEQRAESTKAAMQFVGGLIETYKAEQGEYPPDMSAARAFAEKKDPRIAKFIEAALVDAWGKPLVYQRIEVAPEPTPQAEPAAGYSLVSLGADGATGGDAANADLDIADQDPPGPMTLSKEDGLQSQLADALGLEFQLDALPYDSANWRCSDMAMDEITRRLAAKGLDFEEFGGTLAGSSLPAKIISALLVVMKAADAFMEGAIADTFKVVMIEMLGNEKLIDQSMAQFGEGFSDVIVNDRNQVAIDDLKRLIEQEPNVKSIAVLYGAAHMPDMSKRLSEQLGFEPAPADQIKWLTAIEVDMTKSAVSPAEINRIRAMIKQMVRQQLRNRR